MGKRLLLWMHFFALPLMASHVLKTDLDSKRIQISQDRRKNSEEIWGTEDRVCVIRQEKEIACGIVTAATTESAEVSIDYQRSEVLHDSLNNEVGTYIQLTFVTLFPERGEPVRLVNRNPKPQIRELTSQLQATTDFGGSPLKTAQSISDIPARPFVPNSDLTIGMNYVFPTIEYQQTISFHSSIGIMPIFMDYPVSDGYLRGNGGFLQYHYYTEETFHGYWAKLGLGLYHLSSGFKGAEDSAFAPALSASFGHRLFWSHKLNFGFAVGGQYVLATTSTGLPFNGFIPSITLDVGFAF